MDTAELQSKLQQSLFQGIPKNYSKDASLGKKKKKVIFRRNREGKGMESWKGFFLLFAILSLSEKSSSGKEKQKTQLNKQAEREQEGQTSKKKSGEMFS